MATSPARKDKHLETLRGMACVLLVAYHVIGNDPAHGMHIDAHDNWRLFTELFIHIRMPLFSFLSGYVFSAIVADRAGLATAIGKKLRRLGIPLVVVSTLFYLCFGLINGGFDGPIWQIYVLPYQHYWYLQATLLIMIGVLVGCHIAGRQTRIFMTALFPLACAVFIAAPVFEPDVLAISSAFYLLPFFLLGQLLRVWSAEREIRAVPARRVPLVLLFGAVVAILFVLDLAQYEGFNQLNFDRQSALGLLFGVSACLFLYLSRIEWRPLEFIGAYSYSIYLFHVFFTAALRRSLGVIFPGITSGVFFVSALVAGLFLPIVVHQVLIRWRWTALLFLGISRPKRPPTATGAESENGHAVMS
ncbi:acyltransferase family protein [Kaistia granuli]|uniref:acyltransferase family protein n=1 Tax=Kaistia granuli TaxID=363259 RepID=UPI0009FF813C|nr:acyltransferase [Kaistia granuli]